MKKLVFLLIFLFIQNTQAIEDIDNIIQICSPHITDEYTPDIVLKQQYEESSFCLKHNIQKLAKDIFNQDKYNEFCTYLSQATDSYLQIVLLLNEHTKGIDGLPGTFDQLEAYSQLYNFLSQLLEVISRYHLSQSQL